MVMSILIVMLKMTLRILIPCLKAIRKDAMKERPCQREQSTHAATSSNVQCGRIDVPSIRLTPCYKPVSRRALGYGDTVYILSLT